MPENSTYFQDHMPENVCFGCGIHNEEGLHVKSEWKRAVSISGKSLANNPFK